jgi:hypothetical protein
MSVTSNGKWCIESEILHELVTYGDGKPRRLRLGGNWSVGHGFPMVKGILTWLVMRALSVERLPWMGDWPFTRLHDEKTLSHALQYLHDHPQEVEAACDEIRNIYAHTQRYFEIEGTTHIDLGRGFKNDESFSQGFCSYATSLLRVAQASKLLGRTHLDVPHDVVTSWGFGWDYSGCVAGVKISHPVTDVLVGADILQPRSGAIGQNAMESGEWLVLNRNINGMLRVPVANVQALAGFNFKSVAAAEAEEVLKVGIPPLRGAAQFYSSCPGGPRVKQSLASRLNRARRVLFDTYQ